MAASRKFGGNKKKNEISYNLVGDRLHGGGAGFQPGSTFKPFTLLAALDQGMKLDDGFNTGTGYQAPSHSSFRDCKGNAVGEPGHTVTNSSEGPGGFNTLTNGTLGSVNTFFMRLEQEVGLCETVKMAKSLGIQRADGAPLKEFETFTLGINETDPVTLSAAYAAIAARGTYCKPMVITESTDRERQEDVVQAQVQAGPGRGGRRRGHPHHVRGLHQGHDEPGRRHRPRRGRQDRHHRQLHRRLVRRVHPDLASAVSIGDPRGAFGHDLIGVTIGGRYYSYVYGSSIAGPIWKNSMLGALRGVSPTSFTRVNMARFGGCSGNRCAPKPPPESDRGDRGDRGDQGNQGGRGDRGGRGDQRGGGDGREVNGGATPGPAGGTTIPPVIP